MYSRSTLLSLLAAACPPVFGVQLITNGSFDTDLNGWTTNGQVSAPSGFALLEEGQLGATSALFQTIAITPDPLVLTFDLFIAGMSAAIPGGAVADTSFGSIYFGDGSFGSDATAGTFDEQVRLFNLDHNGLAPAAGVTVETSPVGPNWARLVVPVSSTRTFGTLVIEEVDLNLTPGDSVVTVDNASLLVIPEPATGLLLLFSIGLFAAKRTRPT